LLEDLTADRNKLEQAINLFKPGQGTSFYDALQLTIDEVLKPVEGRKAIVALTDGVDSYGFGTFDQLIPELEKAGASIYFLELDTEAFTEAGITRHCADRHHFEFSLKQLKKYVSEYAEGADPADYQSHCRLSSLERLQINRRLYESARHELREMATKTGGRVYPVKQLQQLEPAYAQIAAELRAQYSIGYYPINDQHDGKWRALRVEITRSGLAAQTRPGYRAPKD
jgi:VWFA-related protein